MSKRFARYLNSNRIVSIVAPDLDNVYLTDCDATGLASECFLKCEVTDDDGVTWTADLNRYDVVDYINGDA